MSTETPTHVSGEIFTWKFPEGYGKRAWMHDQMQQREWKGQPPMFFKIGDEMIIGKHYDQFEEIFGLARGNEHLLSLRNNVRFAVEGFDDDPREVFEIPEVRECFAGLLQTWPCYSFFSDLRDKRNIRMIAACSCEAIPTVKRDRDGEIHLEVKEEAIRPFCVKSFIVQQTLAREVRIPFSDGLFHHADALEALVGKRNRRKGR